MHCGQIFITRDIYYNLRVLFTSHFTLFAIEILRFIHIASLSDRRNSYYIYTLLDGFPLQHVFQPLRLFILAVFCNYKTSLAEEIVSIHSIRLSMAATTTRAAKHDHSALTNQKTSQISSQVSKLVAILFPSLCLKYEIPCQHRPILFSFLGYTTSEISRAIFQPSSRNLPNPRPRYSHSQSPMRKMPCRVSKREAPL